MSVQRAGPGVSLKLSEGGCYIWLEMLHAIGYVHSLFLLLILGVARHNEGFLYRMFIHVSLYFVLICPPCPRSSSKIPAYLWLLSFFPLHSSSDAQWRLWPMCSPGPSFFLLPSVVIFSWFPVQFKLTHKHTYLSSSWWESTRHLFCLSWLISRPIQFLANVILLYSWTKYSIMCMSHILLLMNFLAGSFSWQLWRMR